MFWCMVHVACQWVPGISYYFRKRLLGGWSEERWRSCAGFQQGLSTRLSMRFSKGLWRDSCESGLWGLFFWFFEGFSIGHTCFIIRSFAHCSTPRNRRFAANKRVEAAENASSPWRLCDFRMRKSINVWFSKLHVSLGILSQLTDYFIFPPFVLSPCPCLVRALCEVTLQPHTRLNTICKSIINNQAEITQSIFPVGYLSSSFRICEKAIVQNATNIKTTETN
jgi:hypothetical protein